MTGDPRAPRTFLAWRWPGFNERGSLVLTWPGFLHAFPLPGEWAIDGCLLQRKQEFHLTVLGRHEAERVRGHVDDDAVRACFEGFAWSPGAMTACWYLVSADPDRRSIVATFEAAALNPFRAQLAQRSGVDLSATVPHVTLFVSGSPKGIGIESVAAFEALRRCRVDVFGPVPGRG